MKAKNVCLFIHFHHIFLFLYYVAQKLIGKSAKTPKKISMSAICFQNFTSLYNITFHYFYTNFTMHKIRLNRFVSIL